MLLFSSLILSQNVLLNINGIKDSNFKKKLEFVDSVTAINHLKSVVNQLIFNGYASSIVDSIIIDSNIYNAYIYQGEIYKWGNFFTSFENSKIIENAGFRKSFSNNKIFNYNDISDISEKVLTYLENNGYPFASVSLDSINFLIPDNIITASIKIEKGPLIIVDSIIVSPENEISKSFLYNYIGIKPGDKYNENKISEIDKKIKELEFITIVSASEIIIYNDKAKIVINAKKKNASSFTGIIGFMPSNGDEKKLLINGEILLNLKNTLKYGEKIGINWRKTDPLSQELKTQADIPYLLNSPIGVEYKLNIQKRDTTYLNISNRFGLKYMFNYTNYFNAYFENKQSKLLSTKGLKQIKTLPTHADITSKFYGIEFYNEKFNYRNNPIKGYSFLINLSTGTKNIKKNQDINPDVYENISLKMSQYRIEAQSAFFIHLGGKNTIGLFNKSAMLTGSKLFANELFRIGGLNTLRGFDEEAIFSSTFSIFTIEYRFLLDENSFIQIFWDGAYYETKTLESFKSDTPYGFGAGITFDTKAGMFSLNYALGKQANNPIRFNASKIHFGIVGRF